MFSFCVLIYEKVIFFQKTSFQHLEGAVEFQNLKDSNFALKMGGVVKKKSESDF